MFVMHRALFLFLFAVLFSFLHGSAHRPDPQECTCTCNNNKSPPDTVVVKSNITIANPDGEHHQYKHQKTVRVHDHGDHKHKANQNGKHRQVNRYNKRSRPWVAKPKQHRPWTRPRQDSRGPKVEAEIKQALPSENKPITVIVASKPKPANYIPDQWDPDPAHPYASVVSDAKYHKYEVVKPNKPPPTAEQLAADEKLIKQQTNTETMEKEKDLQTRFKGDWKLHSSDAKVSAMQMLLLPNNKAIFSDTISFGPSNITVPLPHPQNCRQRIQKAVDKYHIAQPMEPDCFAHAVEYDVETAAVRPLRVYLDQWCSSGGLSPTGALVSTGGWEEGYRALRHMDPCPTCDFVEKPGLLASNRWYATQITLEDGNFVMFGGRQSYSYEFFPSTTFDFKPRQIDLPFLRETDDYGSENNLYPFVYLLPDGNIYIFANNRSILLEPNTGKVLREYPVLPGGARNYPPSAMSVLLPLDLRKGPNIECEVLICGGGQHGSWMKAEKEKIFLDALQDCGRMTITKPDAKWEIDWMPAPRVMGDMLILPNLEILMVNGAKKGVSGWQNADEPNLVPVLYLPEKKLGERFIELEPGYIPRMYHSSSALLPSGKVLISGSNTNPTYNISKDVRFKTDTSVEMFYPPYLDPKLQPYKPQVDEAGTDKMLKYGQQFKIKAKLVKEIGVCNSNIRVTMYAPPFTSHGYSMSQRMLILPIVDIKDDTIVVTAPANGRLAPKGYHIIWVVHRGVPSNGFWVQIA